MTFLTATAPEFDTLPPPAPFPLLVFDNMIMRLVIVILSCLFDLLFEFNCFILMIVSRIPVLLLAFFICLLVEPVDASYVERHD